MPLLINVVKAAIAFLFQAFETFRLGRCGTLIVMIALSLVSC